VSADLLQSIASNLWSIASNPWPIFLIILFFGGSIFVHEFGHFLAARRRGVHVARFSIGFGPKILAWRGKDGIEYRLSWLPLGGYVALPQLADMHAIEGAADVDVEKLPPLSYGTKMLVFAAGAAFNVVFAFLLACVVWFVGQPTSTELDTTKIGLVLPALTLPDGSSVPSPAFVAGFQAGDVILAIDGNRVTNWPDLQQTLFASGGRSADGRPRAVFTVARGGETLELTVYPRLTGDERMRRIGISWAEEFIVYEVTPGSPAARAGLRPNDQIVALDGLPVLHSSVFVDHLRKNVDRPITLTVLRAGRRTTLPVPPRTGTVNPVELGLTFKSGYKLVYPDPFTQIEDNAVMVFRVLAGLINPQSDLGVSKLSGPVGIVRIFYATAQSDIRLVLWFTILLNVNLAIFNLLPIPVFDGGHMLFATIGWLRGRALPASFIMTAQSVFFVLIISLFCYLTFSDFRRWVRDVRSERAEARQQAAPAAKPAPAPAAP
jgi:regulator of sigma E protease